MDCSDFSTGANLMKPELYQEIALTQDWEEFNLHRGDIAVLGLMRYFSKPLSRSGRGVWGEGLYLMEMRSAILLL
jgi:hypothetical protein